MGRLTVTCDTSLTQQQFITGLTDFSANRGISWGNSQAEYLTVHSFNSTAADVTEGSDIFGGVWERLRYDWSDPNCITLTTLDSNFWKPGSNWCYTFSTSHDSDRLHVTVAIERFPLHAKARLAMLAIGLLGKIIIKKDLNKTLRALEHNQASIGTN